MLYPRGFTAARARLRGRRNQPAAELQSRVSLQILSRLPHIFPMTASTTPRRISSMSKLFSSSSKKDLKAGVKSVEKPKTVEEKTEHELNVASAAVEEAVAEMSMVDSKAAEAEKVASAAETDDTASAAIQAHALLARQITEQRIAAAAADAKAVADTKAAAAVQQDALAKARMDKVRKLIISMALVLFVAFGLYYFALAFQTAEVQSAPELPQKRCLKIKGLSHLCVKHSK